MKADKIGKNNTLQYTTSKMKIKIVAEEEDESTQTISIKAITERINRKVVVRIIESRWGNM